MKPKKYIQTPIIVEKVELLPDNIEEVIEWLGDSFHEKYIEDKKVKGIFVNTYDGYVLCEFYNYIIKEGGNFWCSKQGVFESKYKPLPFVYIIIKKEKERETIKELIEPFINDKNYDIVILTEEERTDYTFETPYYILKYNKKETDKLIQSLKDIALYNAYDLYLGRN